MSPGSVNPLPTIEAMQENYQKEMIGMSQIQDFIQLYSGKTKTIKSFSKLYNSRLTLLKVLSSKGNLLDIGVERDFFLILQTNEAGIVRGWRPSRIYKIC
ncbi:MAG: hypothetical protein CM1200mP16_15280 [Nitrospina sp.]|nr:MAG: hypothetical protein CM1200mP16_15280 [Nitrospina sp.]